MRYLMKIIKQNKQTVMISLLCGITSAFLSAFGAEYLQRMLDGFVAKTLSEAMIILYCCILAMNILINYFDNAPDIRLENRVFLGLKLMALEKMSVVSLRESQRLGMGSLIQRVENGAQAGKGILYGFWLCILREQLPALLFSLYFIWRIASGVMPYLLAGYAVVFVSSNILLKTLYRIKTKILDNEELLQSHLVRGLMELVVFRTNRRYRAELVRAENAADEVVRAKVSMRMVHEAFFALFALLVTGIKLTILLISWREGILSVGAVVALLTLIDRAYVPIAIGNVLFIQYKLDLFAYGRLTAFLDLPEDSRLIAGETPKETSKDITFSNVSVEYDGRLALDNLSLCVRAGFSTALVGESGSGKSTVAKLMAGLILPDRGAVFLGEQDMASLSLNQFYAHLCYASQETPVFNGTLRENISFDRDLPDALILDALRAAELGSFVDALPNGLETQVGERGVLLSGGERQRLALARVFLTDAEIIILDEATSALDNVVEKAVMKRLVEHLASHTFIIIAHRLSTIVGVDEIIAMRDGKVVEVGSFDELMEKNGYFFALWQAARKEEPSEMT